MKSVELSERERALILWERARQLHDYPSGDEPGCSEFFTAAADATVAAMAAFAAGAYEEAAAGFVDAWDQLSAGEACMQANAILKKAIG